MCGSEKCGRRQVAAAGRDFRRAGAQNEWAGGRCRASYNFARIAHWRLRQQRYSLWRWVCLSFMFGEVPCGESEAGSSRFYLAVRQSNAFFCARLLNATLHLPTYVPVLRGSRSKQAHLLAAFFMVMLFAVLMTPTTHHFLPSHPFLLKLSAPLSLCFHTTRDLQPSLLCQLSTNRQDCIPSDHHHGHAGIEMLH